MTTKTSVAVAVEVAVAVAVAAAAAVAVAATRWRQRFVLAMLSKFLGGTCNTACCHAAGVKVTRIYKIHIDAANVIYQRVTGTHTHKQREQCIKRQSRHKEVRARGLLQELRQMRNE